jgi:asparagine synthase (glutamine-hydrolysing)
MSFIFGKYHIKKQKLNDLDLKKMSHELNFWNADDEGLWKNDYIGLGHLMLWNTPESLCEKLPLKSLHSGNVITADARIDNREELFTKLKITDKSVPDSTLILATYDKYGRDCVNHLLGDFAFVIWDINKEELFCARDHMGIKPFFYYHDNEKFIFASNLKGITSVLKNVKLDDDYINTAICSTPNPITKTCFENIKKLTPAYTLNVSKEEISINQYWDISIKRNFNFQTEEEYIEYFQFLLKDAIQCRSRTAYALGAQLSGGLDSSAIVAIALDSWEGKKSDFHTFTHSLSEKYKGKVFPFKDESEIVKQTIERNNIINNHFTGIERHNSLKVLEDKIDRLGGLFPTGTEEMTLELCSIAQENNVRTILSGFLGDSGISFRANNYQLEMFITGKWKHLITALKYEKKPLLEAIKLPLKIVKYYINTILNNTSINEDEEYFFIKNEFRSPKVKKNLNQTYYPNTIYSLDRQLQLLMSPVIDQRFLLENLTGKEWKVETVYPLADKRIIEFALALPIEFKVKKGIKRYIFKKSMQKYISNDVYKALKVNIITLPLLHKNFLNSFEKLNELIEKAGKDRRFNHIDFDKIKRVMMKTKNIKNRQDKRHAIIVCHVAISYILYIYN